MAFVHCCKKRCQRLKENRTYSEVLRLQELQERRSNIDVNPFTNRNTPQWTFESGVAYISIERHAPLTGSATTLTTQQMNLHTVPHRHTDINESNTGHSGPESESRHVSENAHINSCESLHVNIDELPPSYESVMNADVNSVHM